MPCRGSTRWSGVSPGCTADSVGQSGASGDRCPPWRPLHYRSDGYGTDTGVSLHIRCESRGARRRVRQAVGAAGKRLQGPGSVLGNANRSACGKDAVMGTASSVVCNRIALSFGGRALPWLPKPAWGGYLRRQRILFNHCWLPSAATSHSGIRFRLFVLRQFGAAPGTRIGPVQKCPRRIQGRAILRACTRVT
jgi:hypothetical protein